MPILGGAQQILGPTVVGEVPVIALHTEDPTTTLKTIVRRGFTPIWLSELTDALAGKATLPAQPVCLTYDDGDASWYSRNLALHQQYNVKASLAITSDYLYQTPIAAFTTGTSITWAQARTMNATGLFDWQCHSKTHVAQAGLSSGAFDAETTACVSAIVSELGTRAPTAYIWPYGNLDPGKTAQLRSLGFKIGLSIGCLHPDAHPGSGFTLERSAYVTDLLRWARQSVIYDFENDAAGGRNLSNVLGYWTTTGTTVTSGGYPQITAPSSSFVTTDYFHVSARSLYARMRAVTTTHTAGTAKVTILQYDRDQVALSGIDLLTATATSDVTFDNTVPLDVNCQFVRLQLTSDATFNGVLSIGNGVVHAKQ